MLLGVTLPTLQTHADPFALADYAQAAESLGYSFLNVIEHVVGADLTHRPEWDPDDPWTLENYHEPLILFGFLAGLTRRIEFVTDVLVLPQRQTVLVAKQAAEVDVLSQGRLRLGVGVGWVEPEFQALNEDWHTRGARIAEQVAVLRALWTQEVVTFHGQWHHIDEMGIRPLPHRRPIPIWFGGHAEASLRRVGARGDGWLPLLEPDEEARQFIERLSHFAREAGRDPQSIGIQAHIGLVGKSPDDWRRALEAWRELGATHFSVGTKMAIPDSPPGRHASIGAMQEHIDLIRRFKVVADEVLGA